MIMKLWEEHRPLIYTFIVLLVIGILLNAAVLFAATNEVNRTRDDFCLWAQTQIHIREAQTPSKVNTEIIRSDEQLLSKLHCP